jgi:hypothetical protein
MISQTIKVDSCQHCVFNHRVLNRLFCRVKLIEDDCPQEISEESLIDKIPVWCPLRAIFFTVKLASDSKKTTLWDYLTEKKV